MDWSEDTGFRVILTNTAEMQAKKILDYIFYDLENAQAAFSVEQDMKETAARLSHVAGSLQLCDNPKLKDLGYRTIHFKRHKYFMLYKIVDKFVYIVGVYHDMQDYESFFQ